MSTPLVQSTGHRKRSVARVRQAGFANNYLPSGEGCRK